MLQTWNCGVRKRVSSWVQLWIAAERGEHMTDILAARVLIVEDETLLRLDLEDILGDFGCMIVGGAGRIDSALELAASVDCDVAILDINLGGVRIDPVADVLRARGVPVLFTSGYGDIGLPAGHEGAPLLEKPYQEAALRRAIMDILGRVG